MGKLIIYCFLISINFVIAFDTPKPSPLSILWKMDSPYRHKFGRRYELKNLENGINILSPIGDKVTPHIIPSNPINDAYVRLCDSDDENNNNQLREEFLQELNQSLIFQKAEEFYKDIKEKNDLTDGKNQKSFLENVKEILYFPEENPLFYSLFCRFTSDKGIWHSYIRDQSKLKIISLKNINNTELIKDFQIKLMENGRMRKRRILVGSSIEFEIASLLLCAISSRGKGNWKHCSAPIDGGYKLDIAIKLSENDNRLNIQSFYSRVAKKNKKKHKTDPELQELVTQLWENDDDRVEESAIKLNWQGKLEKKQVKDISPDPLFTSINDSIFKKPIYSALVEMYNEKAFYEQVCEEEPPMNLMRKEKFEKIWKLITDSKVFKLGYQFIRKRGRTEHEIEQFCEEMFDFWFGRYSRCEQNENQEPLGSSGFEHVFSGEWRQGTGVEGHHNWLRFYLQEKQGDINYYGYFEHQKDNIIGTFQYKWKSFLKRIGGFFFRTSPAFDFTLFTVCALVYPGDEACQFELLNTKMFVTTFKMHCNNGTCLATSYPGIF